MTRYQTITEKHEDVTVYVLRDLQSGACARIAPALGANCMELRLSPGPGAAPVAVIDDLQFLGETAKQPSRYGIPILFPWPSGIPEGRFEFEGETYDVNGPENKRSAHHGIVNTAAWKVARSDCDNGAAWLTCEVSKDDCGDRGARFPFPFRLQVTWRLSERGLEMLMQATNTGERTMPMGIGLHPYFTIPFGKPGSRAECRLAATVVRQWNLNTTVDHKPGMPAPGDVFLPAMEFDPTATTGKPLSATRFNHVYEATFDSAGETRASVIDPVNDMALAVSASKDFGTWVIYTPPDRNAISLEPWTLTPNGFNLAAAGVKGTGVITVKPGAAWQGDVRIYLV